LWEELLPVTDFVVFITLCRPGGQARFLCSVRKNGLYSMQSLDQLKHCSTQIGLAFVKETTKAAKNAEKFLLVLQKEKERIKNQNLTGKERLAT
jgi:hypothetical protein